MHQYFRALVAAARRSSGEVLAVTDRAIRTADAAVDAVLFFEVRDCLACVYASGARAEQFRTLRLRQADAALPARAALLAHSVSRKRNGETLLPADRGALAIPAIAERSIRGVWYCSSSSADRLRYESEIARLADCACEPYLLALEREADRADASFDTLTGVLAPSAFRRRLHALVNAAESAVLSLWFVDTDRFKSVNDRFGHSAGDRVLQQMAGLLCDHAAPEADFVGRKGGDEFCVLVRGPSKMRAIARAAAFCAAVRSRDFGIPFRITASIGVAAYPFDGSDAPALLEAADAAMYHAKRAGRDRVAYAVEGAGFAFYE